jgi:hypothetical protein
MCGQIVADAKYYGVLKSANDWNTFAVPGPGSQHGLNYVLGRPRDARWKTSEWFQELSKLRGRVLGRLTEGRVIAAHGREIHNQDLQNCLCEFSKWFGMKHEFIKPKRNYKKDRG